MGKIAKYETEKSVNCFIGRVASHFTDSVFEHHILLEKMVYRNLVLCVVMHRALEIEAQEALYAIASGASGEVAEQHKVQTEWSCKDGVTAEEIDLDLHGVAHPSLLSLRGG